MNSISSLSQNSAVNMLDSASKLLGSETDESDPSFADIFSDALSLAESTESEDKASALSLLTGNTDDIAGVLIDSEKAEIALNLTIQIRNKLMDAYSEIMGMQL